MTTVCIAVPNAAKVTPPPLPPPLFFTFAVPRCRLRQNKSKIRPWWVYHHYFSAIGAICALTWPPDSDSWNNFTPIFIGYFFYLGIVQFITDLYQQKSHYNRVALGYASKMDVVRSETIAVFHDGLTLVVVRHWRIPRLVPKVLY